MKIIATYPAFKDLTLPALPPRTQLYNLPPIGVGTRDVESNTSYGTRQAASINVTSSSLLLSLIGPTMNQLDPTTSRLPLDVYRVAWTYNGQSDSLAIMTAALEQLTSREDLGSLTFARWSKVISMRGIFRQVKAWCPYCYQERIDANDEQYDPLIWTFNLVTICMKHKCRLITHCPNASCRKTNQLLNRKNRIDRCSVCDTLLASTTPARTSDRVHTSEIMQQKFVVDQLSELLRSPDELARQAAPSVVTINIVKFINRFFDGNVYRFSSDLRFPLSYVFSWFGGISIPTLPCLLSICRHFNVSLAGFLTDAETEPKCDVSERTFCHSPSAREIRKRFNRILHSSNTALSLPDISDRLGYRPSFLKYHFPDLCKGTEMRYRNLSRKRRAEKVRARFRTLQMAIILLMKNRTMPTFNHIASMLFKPHLFQNTATGDMARNILSDFGLDGSFLSSDKLNVEREHEIVNDYFGFNDRPPDYWECNIYDGPAGSVQLKTVHASKKR